MIISIIILVGISIANKPISFPLFLLSLQLSMRHLPFRCGAAIASATQLCGGGAASEGDLENGYHHNQIKGCGKGPKTWETHRKME